MVMTRGYNNLKTPRGQLTLKLMNENFNKYLEKDFILDLIISKKTFTDNEIFDYIIHNKLPDNILHFILDK